jgi:hypothetical protein
VLLAALDERRTSTPGLILGYGGATVREIRSGCSLVRELVREVAPRRPA